MRVNRYVPSDEIFQASSTTGKSNTNKTTGIESFSELLSNSLNEINEVQIAADDMKTAFVSGDDVQISDVMLAGEEAKISLQFAVQVRNKLLDAYKELTNIQI